MRHTSAQFVANAHAALNDAGLQPVLNLSLIHISEPTRPY